MRTIVLKRTIQVKCRCKIWTHFKVLYTIHFKCIFFKYQRPDSWSEVLWNVIN